MYGVPSETTDVKYARPLSGALVRSTTQAVTQPIKSATAALANANTSELRLVDTKRRPPRTAVKLSRPHWVTLGSGPATLMLPCSRNRNGGTTSAQRTIMSPAASHAVWRAERRDQRAR